VIYLDFGASSAVLDPDWDKVVQRIDGRELSAKESFAAHSEIVQKNLLLLDKVADASGLSLDPVAETYYLMTAVVDHLPRMAEAVAQMAQAMTNFNYVSGAEPFGTSYRTYVRPTRVVSGVWQSAGTKNSRWMCIKAFKTALSSTSQVRICCSTMLNRAWFGFIGLSWRV
jgi:hypothetical protein